MVEFAINTVGHEDAIPPSELGKWAEENGFSALYYGEHTHFPVASIIPSSVFPDGMPQWYKAFYDPFIALAAVAAVTTSLKLGLAVCLVAQHHPLELAKRLATLDRVSGGRLIFGIGGGWNRHEMADYGVKFGSHWGVIREKIEAMRELWTNDEAEYHGKHVTFDPVWSWPKPLQFGGPPVIMGAGGSATARRVAGYCDGWMPLDGAHDIKTILEEIRREMDDAARSMTELDLAIISGYVGTVQEKRLIELFELGFDRISFFVPPCEPSEQWAILENRAKIVQSFIE
jgi:probable F420-dependent oxidoreductase